MNQYPLNQVDYYDSFLCFLRGISKFQDKPAITISLWRMRFPWRRL